MAGRLLVRAGGAVRNADNTTLRVHPFSCAAQLKPPTHILTRRLKDDPMKTTHFTSVVPPSTEKTIRLCDLWCSATIMMAAYRQLNWPNRAVVE